MMTLEENGLIEYKEDGMVSLTREGAAMCLVIREMLDEGKSYDEIAGEFGFEDIVTEDVISSKGDAIKILHVMGDMSGWYANYDRIKEEAELIEAWAEDLDI